MAGQRQGSGDEIGPSRAQIGGLRVEQPFGTTRNPGNAQVRSVDCQALAVFANRGSSGAGVRRVAKSAKSIPWSSQICRGT